MHEIQRGSKFTIFLVLVGVCLRYKFSIFKYLSFSLLLALLSELLSYVLFPWPIKRHKA